MQEKHVPTARGRVLAEGDVDPAAGSRDEPTRLHVEAPIEGSRYKYTKALFLKSINWVPPPPPTLATPSHTLADCTFLGPGMTPKHVQKTLKKQRAPMEAQRVKTRGPNPNPTAQAQSKRSLQLSTKAQNIVKILPAGLPNPMLFGTFFEAFPRKCLKDSGPRPKVLKGHTNGAPRVPKWRPGVPNWSPEVPRSTKKTTTCVPKSKKSAQVPQWSLKVMHDATKTPRGNPQW